MAPNPGDGYPRHGPRAYKRRAVSGTARAARRAGSTAATMPASAASRTSPTRYGHGVTRLGCSCENASATTSRPYTTRTRSRRTPPRRPSGAHQGAGSRAAGPRGPPGRTATTRIARTGDGNDWDVKDPDVTDLGVLRSFRYPGGRFWAVCVLHQGGDRPSVLRFTAGARNIDLEDWPKDWADLPDEGLVDLLRRAAPRLASSPPDPRMPRRRYDDLRP